MEGCWWIVRGEFLDRGEGVGGGGCGFGCDDVYIWGWLGTLEGGSPFWISSL